MPDEMGLRIAVEQQERWTRAGLHAVDGNIFVRFDFEVLEFWS